MAASGDSWVREYNEAVKLADDITSMISERSSLPAIGPEAQRHSSAIRRKITILGTRLDSLQSLLSKLHGKQSLTEKEMNRRADMVANLRSKVNQMASTLNMSNFANRDSLLGPEVKPVDAMSRANGLDNQGVVGLQRQIMREQDEGLEKLEETVISTKHIALAVNEELDLHARLIDDLDEHVDVTDSRLQIRGFAYKDLKGFQYRMDLGFVPQTKASAEEACNTEQTDKGWLLLLVPDVISYRDRCVGRCCIYADQISVIFEGMELEPLMSVCLELMLLLLVKKKEWKSRKAVCLPWI
ncbi:syntaxin [Sesamum angolense]|uniref:Syntaxin n=1 Tax=Sesamum angolense TaxID=2727404 RepID=A0AAE1WS98_9LAMI|nr:syntaxin [Sesamum angolense]